MTEKLIPDELPEEHLPEEVPEIQEIPAAEIPAEDFSGEDTAFTEHAGMPEIALDFETLTGSEHPDAIDSVADSEMESDAIPFRESFDPDAFLPDEQEEPDVDPSEEHSSDAAAQPTEESVLPEELPSSSEYMDNYPVLPDAVEEAEKAAETTESFDDGGQFQQYFEHDPPKKNRNAKERPTRKGRPKRPKGYGLFGIPHILATVIWLMLILAIGVSLGRAIWVCAADVLAFGREERIVTVSVTTNDTMETIADKLHKAGLVNYPELFLLYADLTDAQEKITTGSFTLNTVYDYHALVNQMSPRSGNRVVIEDVLIPEGYNCAQIFALLEQKGVCKAADLEAWAANGELGDYWFLEGVERGSKYCLEGFLFPDTYDFYENSTPKLALEKMLDGFDYRYSEELHAKLPALNERLATMMRKNGKDDAYIAEHQLDLRKLITVASLIEEETASSKESYKIASVIYNRLFNWGSTPPFLNIDAAIFYALGEHKSALTAEDLQVDSPYNTYRYQGLVPGPISNPGLSSIEAALDPEDTSYYYYVLNPEAGVHDFSKTLSEHEKKVAKYLGGN